MGFDDDDDDDDDDAGNVGNTVQSKMVPGFP